MKKFDHAIVTDPQVFEQNRLSAHSDHEWYSSVESADKGGLGDYKHLLNGIWWFSYAKNYDSCVKDFYRTDYDCRKWDSIRVPAHIQTEGYGVPQYANTQYPWDGLDEVEPGEIPEYFNPVASYVKYFTLPYGFEKGPVCISFQGAESGIAVWLNGKYIGYSEDSFTPSEFDLTDAIDRKGEKFDPNLENAVLQGTEDEGEPGTVCQVLQKGYRMGDKVLRHAMVKVVPE